MSCDKVPPKFKSEDDYELWKNDVLIWCELTEVKKDKQALAIHLGLHGRARIASSELKIAELKQEDGVEKLLAKLDSVFLVEKGRRQFKLYREFHRLRRTSNEDIEEFITSFEHSYYKFKSHSNSELPNCVVAFMLLEACNLDEKDEQLVLSGISEVDYKDVKTTITRIFGGKRFSEVQKESDLKEEPTFFQNSNENETLYAKSSRGGGQRGFGRRRGLGRNRGGFRGNVFRGGNFNRHNEKSSSDKRSNPIDSDGNVLRCYICDSKFHFAQNCPHAYEKQNDRDFNND